MLDEYDELLPFNVDTQYVFVKTTKKEIFEFDNLAFDILQWYIDAPINIIYNVDTRMVSEIILN